MPVIQHPEARARFEELCAAPIVAQILARLREELPSSLYYHSVEHTADVIGEALVLAATAGLPARDTELLAVAAAYHDSGFIITPVDNEAYGARFAREAMQKLGGFTAAEIDCVMQMIMDTRLVESSEGLIQRASGELAKYLLDADLGNLGRDDFFLHMERQRRESGADPLLFMERTLRFVDLHRWQTHAARRLHQATKEVNVARLREMIREAHGSTAAAPQTQASLGRLQFLARLPALLNASLEPERVISAALENARRMLEAEAATIFLLEQHAETLTFWVLQGEDGEKLRNRSIPAHKGIVGWSMDSRQPVLARDAQSDPRFFNEVDREEGFRTRNLICVPMASRAQRPLGAIQVLNARAPHEFCQEDVEFLEQFAALLVPAIENARLHAALKEQNLKLQTLERRKSEVISVIGHEFKTPLNVIQTAAELLAEGSLPTPEQERMSRSLRGGVQRLSRLVSEIRNISLVQSEKLKLDLKRLDSVELVDQAVRQFRETAAQRRLDLTSRVAPNAQQVRGDAALLGIALANLVSNAIRFTPDGGKITISAAQRAGLVHFEVEDTGIGIAASEIPLIFEKFYEVGSSLSHSSGTHEFKSGGLGLGLATAREIVRAHGGDIHVQSEPGKGSVFSFALAAGA